MRVGGRQLHNIQSYHICRETKLILTAVFMSLKKANLRGHCTPTDEQQFLSRWSVINSCASPSPSSCVWTRRMNPLRDTVKIYLPLSFINEGPHRENVWESRGIVPPFSISAIYGDEELASRPGCFIS